MYLPLLSCVFSGSLENFVIVTVISLIWMLASPHVSETTQGKATWPRLEISGGQIDPSQHQYRINSVGARPATPVSAQSRRTSLSPLLFLDVELSRDMT